MKKKKRIRWRDGRNHAFHAHLYYLNEKNTKKAEHYRILAIKALGGKP